MNHLLRLLVLAVVMWSSSIRAAEVRQMYEVSLPVSGQSQELRTAAFEQGFAEILVRVSGSTGLAGIDLAQAPAHIQQYRYLALEPAQTQQPPAGSVPPPTHTLWMRFDEAAIKRLLRSQGLPVWGVQRPATLVLMAVRDGQHRYILREQDASPIREAVEVEARRRGLPLVWPVYSEQDSQLLPFADLWGGFFEQAEVIGKRAGVSVVLIGRMDWQQKKGWQVNWSLLMDGRQQHWQQRSDDLAALMAAGINPLANQLASRYAVLENAGGLTSLQLQVSHVLSAEDYARVTGYLQSLTLVRQAYATDITPGEVRYQLGIIGGEDELRRAIGLERTLSPLVLPEAPVQPGTTPPVTAPSEPTPPVLRYRLN